MKADPAVQQRLLDLAVVDAELSRLAHRRRTLPEHAALTAAEAAVRTAKDKLVESETAAGDLDREIRRLERDVDGVRTRVQRDNGLLAGAGIGAKQAADLQHELETLARRQAVLEDEQLEVMEQREALEVDVEHSRGVLAAAEKEVAAVGERRDSELADIDAAASGRPGPAPSWSPRCPPTCSPPTRSAASSAGSARRCCGTMLPGLSAGARPHRVERPASRPGRRDRVLRGVRCDPGAHPGVRL